MLYSIVHIKKESKDGNEKDEGNQKKNQGASQGNVESRPSDARHGRGHRDKEQAALLLLEQGQEDSPHLSWQKKGGAGKRVFGKLQEALESR